MNRFNLIAFITILLFFVACSARMQDKPHSYIRPTKLRLGISQDSAIRIARLEEWGPFESKNFGNRVLCEFPQVKFSSIEYPFYAKLIFKNDSLEAFDLSLRAPARLVNQRIAEKTPTFVIDDYENVLSVIKSVFGEHYKTYRKTTSVSTFKGQSAENFIAVWIDSSKTAFNKMYELSYTAAFGGAVDLHAIYISNRMLERFDSINR